MGERAPRIEFDGSKYSVRSSIFLWIGLAAGFWLALLALVSLMN
jgi:hypothetical protein